ncbi:glycosyl transferase family protein [Neptuniibacter sp. 2_MG-2023]|jgi:anthranilate phosphoribosyltransferase|uniref:glycosyl transferase family protein n=1 Tax=Neptuniibacter sp. 2_MG-2023 TaxID=3062671 RepID=UPI0026E3FFED|nr:glycosyl transferase family protein [Neptuniibacter sp. 2_MG-2023]MDO6515144.1 glycosyl transferase family protein [Neptuniibacter sp. 2_MG-2023]
MIEEHKFAPFVRILGKGKTGTRSLTREEAAEAMGMILDKKVRPEQLGAFLMLLRVKEEAPEELAGFADAVRTRYAVGRRIDTDLDWSTYAGKKNRHPWYLLVALCLASHGYKIFMHGAKGHTPGRIYLEDMLSLFKLQPCAAWDEVETELARVGFAYMSIDNFCPPLGEIIQLRSILGLRSPVHTLCRMLNPSEAPNSIDGVFHPAYGPMHQKTAQLLGEQRNLTVKGDGGEAEIRPDAECLLQWVEEGELVEYEWQRIVAKRFVKEDKLDPQTLLSVWQGETRHEYGEKAILSTLAVVLRLLGEDGEVDDLLKRAEILWQTRKIDLF